MSRAKKSNTLGSVAIDPDGDGVAPNRWKSNGTDYRLLVKSSRGVLRKLSFSNSDTANAYVSFYNQATLPNRASDIPVATYLVPPGGRVERIPAEGEEFSNGIAFTVTKGDMSDTDTTACSADKLVVNYDYV